MKKLKTIGRVILSLAIIICIGLDFWGLYIHFYAPEKVNTYTFKIGQQVAQAYDPQTGELEDSDDKKWFAEVNIYDNCYEILFNYFTDETRTEFYSQGLQFILDDSSTTIYNAMATNYYKKPEVEISGDSFDEIINDMMTNFKISAEPYVFYYNNIKELLRKDKDAGYANGYKIETIGTTGWWFWKRYQKKRIYQYETHLSDKNYQGLTVTNFASSNDYEDAIYSSNPLNKNSFFTIGIVQGKETKTYKLKVKGSTLLAEYECPISNDTSTGIKTTEEGDEDIYHYKNNKVYRDYDIYYIAEVIYNSCLGLRASTDSIPINFEFGDYFNYYDENGTLINNKEVCDVVENYVKSYWQINVQKHTGNMTKASQSLFKTFKGTTNYDEAESEEAAKSEIFTDYHHGRTILDLNENYFDKILIDVSGFLFGDIYVVPQYKLFLSLKEEFKQFYKPDSKYRLRVILNLDNLSYDNITYFGLVDGTLDGYSIYQVKTTSTATGELIETDITSEVA